MPVDPPPVLAEPPPVPAEPPPVPAEPPPVPPVPPVPLAPPELAPWPSMHDHVPTGQPPHGSVSQHTLFACWQTPVVWP